MGRLSGKVAFITGGARGQGRSHAIRLAQEGADIVVSDVCGPVEGNMVQDSTLEDLQETAQRVEETGQRVLTREVDVRDLSALQSLADDAMAQFGRMDVVIANAGILAWGRAWELSSDEWKSVIDVNLTGVFHTDSGDRPAPDRTGPGWIRHLDQFQRRTQGPAFHPALHGGQARCGGNLQRPGQ